MRDPQQRRWRGRSWLEGRNCRGPVGSKQNAGDFYRVSYQSKPPRRWVVANCLHRKIGKSSRRCPFFRRTAWKLIYGFERLEAWEVNETSCGCKKTFLRARCCCRCGSGGAYRCSLFTFTELRLRSSQGEHPYISRALALVSAICPPCLPKTRRKYTTNHPGGGEAPSDVVRFLTPPDTACSPPPPHLSLAGRAHRLSR